MLPDRIPPQLSIGPLGEGCNKWRRVVLPGAGHTHSGQKSHRTLGFSSLQEALLLVVVPHQHVAAECRGRGSAAPPCPSAGLSSIFSSQFYPKMQPNSHVLWELCFISAFPVSFINRNQVCVVGTSLLWPGPHPHLTSGAPSAAHRPLAALHLRAWQLLLQNTTPGLIPPHPIPGGDRDGSQHQFSPSLGCPHPEQAHGRPACFGRAQARRLFSRQVER